MATEKNLYPKHFIEKVKRVYPNHSKIIELAENHSYELGTELKGEFRNISDKLANCNEYKAQLQELFDKRKDIYEQWGRDYKTTCTQYIPSL